MSKLKALDEFAVSKNGIGFVDSDFKKKFGNVEFETKHSVPSFQKLPRVMTGDEMEAELKVGLSDLGDVLAFIQNPQEGTKDGWSNIFLFKDFVVRVLWDDA